MRATTLSAVPAAAGNVLASPTPASNAQLRKIEELLGEALIDHHPFAADDLARTTAGQVVSELMEVGVSKRWASACIDTFVRHVNDEDTLNEVVTCSLDGEIRRLNVEVIAGNYNPWWGANGAPAGAVALPSTGHTGSGQPHPGFVCVDVETTGFHTGSDRLVSFAALPVNAYTLEPEGDMVASTVNPGRRNDAVHVNQLTDHELASAPTFKQVAHQLADTLHGRVLVAHNLAFDWRFLRWEFDMTDVQVDLGSGLCTLGASGGFNLPDACHRFGVPFEETHNSVQDLEGMVEMMRALPGDEPLALNLREMRALPTRPVVVG